MDNSIGNSNFYRNYYNSYNNNKSQDVVNNNQDQKLNQLNKENNQIKNSVNMKDKVDNGECKTCRERKYQDVSNDASVSFQTPTHISPENSAAKVASHEMEHVVNERASAKEDEREIISQSVTLQTGVCPECGITYISGGQTVTVSKNKPKETENDFFVDSHKKFLQGFFGTKIDARV